MRHSYARAKIWDMFSNAHTRARTQDGVFIAFSDLRKPEWSQDIGRCHPVNCIDSPLIGGALRS